MKPSTGPRWVSGDDFFDRETELQLLESRVRDGNHVLLTGQRRMGKTSIAKELGRRLETQGWVFLFTDVEGATSERDVIAGLARALEPARPILSRFAGKMKRWLGEQSEQELAAERNQSLVTMQDVDEVYRTVLLGSSEDNDLFHYQTRLKEGLNDENRYTIALEILAETATQGKFTPEARRCLARLYSPDERNVPGRIADVLDVLIHDGYLQDGENGYHFPFRLLRDWWSNRFRDQHTPLAQRSADEDGGLQ